MIGLRWRKVFRDLWHNRIRTLLVVLSIAVGVFAVGTVVHTQILVASEMQSNYASASPASASLYADGMDDDLLAALNDVPEVQVVEGRSAMVVQIQTAPDAWRALVLNTLPDFENTQVNKVLPVYEFDPAADFGAERGTWPPGEQELVLERASLLIPGMVPAGLQAGDTVLVETPDNRQRELRVAGLAYEPNAVPATFMNTPVGYVTRDTLEWLGGPRSYNGVHVIVTGDPTDTEHVTRVANQIARKIERSGRIVDAKVIHDPGQLPLDYVFQGIAALLVPLGLLSLILSAFLVINTISALLARHVRQIGVMKAIGARNGVIVRMYLSLVLIFGLLALLIAVPLGALAASRTTQLLAVFLNVSFPAYSLPPAVLVIEIVMGLAVPLLAALYPIFKGTRLTVREAISDYGVGQGHFGTSLIDRVLSRLRRAPRPLLISLRNTFRRRGRLVLTLLTLTLGGMTFIAVLSVHESLQRTMQDVLRYLQFDVQVQFGRQYRIQKLEQIALQVPGVVRTESWDIGIARRLRPDGTESDNVTLWALPAATELLEPTLIQGRWLEPGDENAIVVNQDVLKNEPDVQLDDEIVLTIAGQETSWRVVGVVRTVMLGVVSYVNYPHYARIAGDVGRASAVQVVTEQHDTAFQEDMAAALEESFEAEGLRVTSKLTLGAQRENIEFYFAVIVTLLLVMAILIASVGALGLTGTMYINVMERTREIGIMRAVGASDRAVLRIVIVEGMLIGLLSGLLGALLAFPLGQALSMAVGVAILQTALSYTFSTAGVVIWLVIVLLLSAIASLLPARSAARLTVREVLAYE